MESLTAIPVGAVGLSVKCQTPSERREGMCAKLPIAKEGEASPGLGSGCLLLLSPLWRMDKVMVDGYLQDYHFAGFG
jgi:hypothetical protein